MIYLHWSLFKIENSDKYVFLNYFKIQHIRNFMKKSISILGFLLFAKILLTAELNAQTVTTTYSEGGGSLPTVADGDLLQNFASLTATSGSFTNEGTSDPTILTDGLASFSPSGKSGIFSGSSLTYTFTNSPTGTDVTGIDIYSVWGDNGRLTPNVTVSYSLKSSPETFITLTTATFNPSVGGSNVWTKSSLAISDFTGLAAIKFDFPSQQNNFVGYTEIDVFGDANIVDIQNPTSPTNLVSPSKTNELIFLSWDASSDDVGVIAYNIYQGGVLIGTSATTSYTVTGLNASTAYSFTVKAKDASNKLSDESNTLIVTTSAQPNFSITYSEGGGSSPTISNSDLLQTNATLTASSGSFTRESEGDVASLTNGNASLSSSDRAGIESGSSLTYTLTGSSTGFSISKIDIYSTWGDNGRLIPNVTVSYSLTSNPGVFIPIATATFNPSIQYAPVGIWTKSSFNLIDYDGVEALKFDFPNQQNGWVGYNEIDVTGTPSPIQISANTNISSLSLTPTTSISVENDVELVIDANTTLKDIRVKPNGKLTIAGSNTISTTDGVALQSDNTGSATLIDNYTTPTINATVEQYVGSGRNWYLSSPITNADFSALSRGTSVVEFNETTKSWENVTSGNLMPGKGYVQVATSTPTVTGTTGLLTFSSLTNSGDVTVGVSRTESGASRGFNLVGNPYPSYLDWSLVKADAANADISSTIWFRTKNTSGNYTFATHNGTSGETVTGTANTTITKFIPPMQAFWIRVNENLSKSSYNSGITFKNTMRSHRDDNENLLKAPKIDDRKRLRLQLTNGSIADETLVYFDANAKDDFDNYDSQKMFNNITTQPELYTKLSDEKLVINGLCQIKDNSELVIGYNCNQGGELKFQVVELKNLDNNKIFLLDKLTNIETELTAGTEYSFSSSAAANNETRFSLIFHSKNNSTAIEETLNTTINVFVNPNNELVIMTNEKSNYAIFNAIGQKIDGGTITSEQHTSNHKLRSGIYVVKVNNVTSRVIIK